MIYKFDIMEREIIPNLNDSEMSTKKVVSESKVDIVLISDSSIYFTTATSKPK